MNIISYEKALFYARQYKTNIAHVYSISKKYNDALKFHLYNKISFHTFLFKEMNIKKTEYDNLWLVKWNPEVMKEQVIKDKNGKDVITLVHIFPKFSPFIINTCELNEGWRGLWLENMRRYILLTVDVSKKSMIENILKELKNKEAENV